MEGVFGFLFRSRRCQSGKKEPRKSPEPLGLGSSIPAGSGVSEQAKQKPQAIFEIPTIRGLYGSAANVVYVYRHLVGVSLVPGLYSCAVMDQMYGDCVWFPKQA